MKLLNLNAMNTIFNKIFYAVIMHNTHQFRVRKITISKTDFILFMSIYDKLIACFCFNKTNLIAIHTDFNRVYAVWNFKFLLLFLQN